MGEAQHLFLWSWGLKTSSVTNTLNILLWSWNNLDLRHRCVSQDVSQAQCYASWSNLFQWPEKIKLSWPKSKSNQRGGDKNFTRNQLKEHFMLLIQSLLSRKENFCRVFRFTTRRSSEHSHTVTSIGQMCVTKMGGLELNKGFRV